MLHEKVAVITGASGGIGLATVELFAKNQAVVWACARRKTEEFENRLKEISLKYGAEVFTAYFDITDKEAVKAAVRRIGGESKRIDILVNNAGISVEKLFNMTSADVLRKVMEVNFVSQIGIAQLISRYMIKNKNGGGSIVNVASETGIAPQEGSLAYGSSKSAVAYATRVMAMELAKYNVRVNAVSPGFIRTAMWDKRNEEIKDKILKQTPLGRQGKPSEAAEAILFLASDMASFVTGQNIIVNGGRKIG